MPGPDKTFRPRVLLIGSDTVHMVTYYRLVRDACEAVQLVSSGADKVGSLNPTLVAFGLKNPLSVRRSVKRLREIHESFRPDIVHVHQANSFAFITVLALKKFNIPIVLTTWGSDVLVLPDKNFPMKAMVRYNLKHAAHVTADAGFMVQRIRELAGPTKAVTETTFGVDLPTETTPKQNVVYSNRLHKPTSLG